MYLLNGIKKLILYECQCVQILLVFVFCFKGFNFGNYVDKYVYFEFFNCFLCFVLSNDELKISL